MPLRPNVWLLQFQPHLPPPCVCQSTLSFFVQQRRAPATQSADVLLCVKLYGVCMVCVWVYGVCMVCVWCVYGVCMVCIWCVYSVCIVCVYGHGVCIWCVCMVCVWCVYGVCMVCTHASGFVHYCTHRCEVLNFFLSTSHLVSNAIEPSVYQTDTIQACTPNPIEQGRPAA